MFLIRYIPVFFLFAGFAQTTNIELLPIPKVASHNLRTLTFNDGTPLIKIDESEIISWISNPEMKETATVLKLQSGDFLYNYYAVKENKICPYGSRSINRSDLSELIWVQNKSSKINLKDLDSFNRINTFKDAHIVQIVTECDNHEIIVSKIPSEEIGVFSSSTSARPYDSRYLSYYKNPNYYSPIDSNYYSVNDFLPLRCIEDINYKFTNQILSYGDLLPKSYNAFLIELSRKLLLKTVNNNVSDKNMKATLLFDHNGNNVSKVFGMKENNFFQAQLKNELLAFKKYAYYDGIKVSTQDDLVIEFRDENNNKAESINFNRSSLTYHWFNENPTLNSFNFCKKYLKSSDIQDLLTAEIKPFPYSVYINNQQLATEKKYITHFNIAGPLSPLTSLILPGFGSNRLNLTRSSKIHITLATITIATFIASFVLSKSFYRKYLDNIETDPFYESNFNTANTFHKIAIGSMIFYPVLSLSDIVTCYANKLNLFGNKKIQRKMNDELKENNKKGIYLCN